MQANNHALSSDASSEQVDESMNAQPTARQRPTEQNSAYVEQTIDFHHCGQEIENVVVLSIN